MSWRLCHSPSLSWSTTSSMADMSCLALFICDWLLSGRNLCLEMALRNRVQKLSSRVFLRICVSELRFYWLKYYARNTLLVWCYFWFVDVVVKVKS